MTTTVTKKSSGLGGGLWIILVVLFGGAIFFFVKAWLSHNSGSTIQMPDGNTISSDVKVSLTKIGYFWYSIVLFVAGVLAFFSMKSDR